MGQGYSINVSAGSAGIDVPELADLETERSLGAVRFMKTIRAKHKDGLVIAKVFIKPFPNLKLEEQSKILFAQRRDLADVPNTLPYHRIIETATNGYLVRQYIHSSLYDRISTNPSLEDIERKWIAYQLLCAVKECHSKHICHGDIKTENMLVTTWNWLYLTDFSTAFKPGRLPENNPANFSIFFDTTGRRICYIAPERFVDDEELKEHEPNPQDDVFERDARKAWHNVTWPMDIFSVGCVIAELFTEKPTFTLSQLFKYRKGEYDPTHTTLNNIKDENIREMVAHMIQLEPGKRYSAEDYLNFWRGKSFPEYFYTFLHQYMHLITDPTSGRKPVVVGAKNSGGSDDRIERINADFDKISYFLGFSDVGKLPQSTRAPITSGLDLFPLQVDLPNNRHDAADRAGSVQDNGALLFLNVVISALRTTARASSKIRGCELLLALGERLTDEAKLDRVLPFAIALLEDESENVRMAALRTITQLLAIVTVLSPMNVFIFPNYLLPRLQKFVASPMFRKSGPLRATYATCLANLATTAARFLDMMQALRADGSLPSTDPEAEDDLTSYAAYQNTYDTTREDLIQHFEAQTKLFLQDDDPSVKRAFLGSVTSLCVFFGENIASDLILTHLNTYLNEEDWTLKCAFFETIVGVAAFIGGASLEDFILPLMVQALTDPEETVTEQVIRSLSSMAHLGLFQRWTTIELVLIVSRFTLHPNVWIREAAVQFIEATSTHLSDADVWSMVMPLLKPVLKMPSAGLSEFELLDALQKPFPRPAYDLAKTWAEKSEKSVFWKHAQQVKSFSFEAGSNKALTDFYRDSDARALSKAMKNDDDEQWLAKLRVAGMRTEDEPKLLALRDYIWRTTMRSEKEVTKQSDTQLNQIVSLSAIQVPLQNVFFEADTGSYQTLPQADIAQPNVKTSLEEALRDAATPADQDARNLFNPARGKPYPSSAQQTSNTAAPADVYRAQATPINGQVSNHRKQMANIDTAAYLSTSPASTTSVRSGHNHTLHSKASAMNLMKRTEQTKAYAETGTDSINAVGKLDVPANQAAIAPSNSNSGQATPRPSRPKISATHSYHGGDPTVLKLLDSVYTGSHPGSDREFGPRVSTRPRARMATKNAPNQQPQSYWKPEGQLTAVLEEHQAQVNCIAVSPDQVFFLTGSDDGSVKVWDTSRFERNMAHRSRQAHRHASGASITSLCFVDSTHSFISTASDGTVDIVKVDVTETNGNVRYGKLQVLRSWMIPAKPEQKEYAIGVEHGKMEGRSVCVVVTNLCRILFIDIYSMEVTYELQNPIQHGTPTTFCISKRWQWLLIGTSHGVLDIWDLRFRLRLRAWTVPRPAPITRLTLHPSRKDSKKVKICVAGLTSPGHVSVWDLEKLVCTEVYHVSQSDGGSQLKARDFELLNVDEDKSGTMPSRILGSLATDLHLSARPSDNGKDRSGGGSGGSAGAVKAFAMSMHTSPDSSEPRHPFLVTTGPDWKIRFWDTDRIASSMIVNDKEDKALYTASKFGNDISVYTEMALSDSLSEKEKGTSSPASGRTGTMSPISNDADSDKVGAASKKKKENREGKIARYEVIRRSANQLLKGHKDTVTAVALLEYPFGMIISADRSGALYIFR
ncbi:ARM repeat-containing protein [Aureobasidium pullulans]|uniref:non-specific serine/threonine protein kinase n=1 Tax=Aureobasidium pullulans TaxID=5580 RepID=A0A4S9VY56_AURPU|nr:ARM repeat-containing protein [Aureobasidium pullulans]THZ39879.1 ARM repeat-containing protein [Aureobasidium pullulans]THZ56918.1 ARM repeat-containing protein [Aureobasidium pullulans]